jgi:fatty-acyl-CoA synthase
LRDFGPGAVTRIAASRCGSCPAIADERGELTCAELDEQVDRLANALRAQGIGAGSSLGVLCRNYRSPLIVACADARLRMNTIWVNTV